MICLASAQLHHLLLCALHEGPLYSVLVRWTLCHDPQASSLAQLAHQQAILQDVQLPEGSITPQDMQQCALQMAEQCVRQACCLDRDNCVGCSGGGGGGSASTSINTACSQQLLHAAARLAKLHGHLLAHCTARNLAEQLHLLLLALTSAPLRARSSSKAAAPQLGDVGAAASSHGDVCAPQPVVLGCRTCAARYAAKALECCSRLLACLPLELLQALAASPHLQHFSPSLATLLARAAAAAVLAPTGSAPPWQQQQPGPPADGTPAGPRTKGGAAAAADGSGGRSARPGRVSHTPGSGGSASSGGRGFLAAAASVGPAGSRVTPVSRGSAGARLSGLGLLLPSGAVGSGPLPSRPSSAGAGVSLASGGGRSANTAAVCNREKSRDAFFSILRHASSRLDAIRAAPEAAAAGEVGDSSTQAATAAAAAPPGSLSDLLSDMALASRQLLLQLAPANLASLADLFTACVLQAASTGEPILEPALVLMADRDPSKFQKLQQRLADDPQSAAAAGRAGGFASAAAATAATPLGGPPRQAGAPLPVGDGGGSSSRGGRGGQPSGSQKQQPHRARIRPVQQQQQSHLLAAAGVQQQQQHADQHVLQQHNSSGPGKAGGGHARRHIAPQQQQQRPGHGASLQPGGSSGKGATPVPFNAARVAGGGVAGQSPLNAACLSPLFAAAAGAGASPVLPTPAVGALSSRGGCGTDSITDHAAGRTAAGGAGDPSSSTAQAAATPGASSNAAAAADHQAPGAQSAPPKLQACTVTPGAGRQLAAGGGAGHGAPGRRVQQAAEGPAAQAIIQQLLAELPLGQHVLLLFLHAADSSSFNQCLLSVMLARTERLLHSKPGSFVVAAGLGQQAAAVEVLATYCSYLTFVAGCGDHSSSNGSSSLDSTSKCEPPQQLLHGAGLLQQQPGVDVAAMLSRVLASCSAAAAPTPRKQQQQQVAVGSEAGAGSSALDDAWLLALAVPFAVHFLRFAGLNAAMAACGSISAAARQLAALLTLPCYDPAHPSFGGLPICLSSMVHSCQLLYAAGRTAAFSSASATAAPAAADGLCAALGAGNSLLDSSYWYSCNPGLLLLLPLLHSTAQEAAAAAAEAPPRHNHQQLPAAPPSAALQGISSRGAGAADSAALPPRGSPPSVPAAASSKKARSPHVAAAASGEPAAPATTVPTAAATGEAGAADAALAASGVHSSMAAPAAACAAPAAEGCAPSRASSSARGSPATTGSVRHTTPLMLAPRAPPALDQPPPCVSAALAAVSDPLRQQLQQAFLGQYSTDDNPVKMRDVLTVINGILTANSLSRGVSHGVPPVLQQHLAAMEQQVLQTLAPQPGAPAPAAAAAGGAAGGEDGSQGATRARQLHGQELARAVHTIYSHSLPAATHDCLEAAMTTAAQHASSAAAAACAALLPADVPAAAAATAAALVVAACSANCAQRLMQEVPGLVQSTLADAADDLVRLVDRQWAVHTRLLAAQPEPPAAAAAATNNSTTAAAAAAGARPGTRGGSSTGSGQQPARLQPVPVDAASAPSPVSGSPPTAPQQQPLTAAAGAGRDAAASSCDSGSSSATELNAHSSCSMSTSLCDTAVPDQCVRGALAAAGKQDSRRPECAAAAAVAACQPPAAQRVIGAFLRQGSAQLRNARSSSGCVDAARAASLAAAADEAARELLGDCATAWQDLEQQVLGCIAGGRADGAADAVCGSSHDASAQHEDERQLGLLLAGALMHALMSCTAQRQAVWGGRTSSSSTAGADGAAATAAPPPYFVQLPMALMKAARADGTPLWVLAQLRAWMQAGTLGLGL